MANRILTKQLDLIPTKASLDELREAAKSCKKDIAAVQPGTHSAL